MIWNRYKRIRKEILRGVPQKHLSVNGFYFEEMKEYVEAKKIRMRRWTNRHVVLFQRRTSRSLKQERQDQCTDADDLNFFMDLLRIPTILCWKYPDAMDADGICKVWSRTFKESDIQHTTMTFIYTSFGRRSSISDRPPRMPTTLKLFGCSSFVFFKCFDEVASR